MKLEEKRHFIHQVAAMLQNNHGNRLTSEITNGVLSQLDAVIAVDPPAETEAAQPAPAGPKAPTTLADLPAARKARNRAAA